MTHASGRPVMALSLAEQYMNGELYREASRFVLDQRELLLSRCYYEADFI
jgi:hypothetical protein